jgi:FKBP-type peptidyl-prolyl cis-trans isomerase
MKYLLLFFPVLFGCGEGQENPIPKEPTKDWSMGHSVDYNQEVSAREDLAIKFYLEHHKGLEMTTSSSTLRYQIVSSNAQNKKSVEVGNLVSVKMKISLLDGSTCYESDSIPDQFILGKSDLVSSGLHEGILLMNESDKAKLIVPSVIGYGLLGDESKNIPAQSVLIYDVELVTVNK